jgi:hypothetical protein
MSQENAVRFLQALHQNQALRLKVLDGSATLRAWLAAAAAAGFETTADELRSVVEDQVGKPLTSATLVGALRGLFEDNLAEESLALVVAGLSKSQQEGLRGRINQGKTTASEPFVKLGPPTWIKGPKTFQ